MPGTRSSILAHRFAALTLAGGLLAMTACEPGAPPPTTCAEFGARCRLADGPLGVCESAPCGPGESPPCFRCVPQH